LSILEPPGAPTSAALAAETAARIAGDAALQTSLTTTNTNVTAEAQARASADTVEQAARVKADTAEEQARIIADAGQTATINAGLVQMHEEIAAVESIASVNGGAQTTRLTHLAGAAQISSVGSDGTTLTILTSGAHQMADGDRVNIVGTTNYNGTFGPIDVISANEMRIPTSILASASETVGTVRTAALRVESTADFLVGMWIEVVNDVGSIHISPITALDASTIHMRDPILTSWLTGLRASATSMVSITLREIMLARSGIPTTLDVALPRTLDMIGLGHRVEAYGAVGDGVVDDTAAIQACINAAGPSDTVIFRPDRTYRTTAPLVATQPGQTRQEGQTWIMYGATILVDHPGAGIVLGENRAGQRLRRWQGFGGRVTRTGAQNWTDGPGEIGVLMWNPNYCSWQNFVIDGFYTGLKLVAANASGACYNTFQPQTLEQNRTAIMLWCESGGWCSENTFYGNGSMSCAGVGATRNAGGAFYIVLDRDRTAGATTVAALNGNKFYDMSLESNGAVGQEAYTATAIYANCSYCIFQGLRLEWTQPGRKLIKLGADSAQQGGNQFTLPNNDMRLEYFDETECGTATGHYYWNGRRNMHLGGGDGVSPLLRLREISSNTNQALIVTRLDNVDRFTLSSNGAAEFKMPINASAVAQSFGGSVIASTGNVTASAGGVVASTQLYVGAGNVVIADVTKSVQVGSFAVVGQRKTGWVSQPTGTLDRTTFVSDTVTHLELAKRVAALLTDLRAHGLIGT
jgi:hypothetical protein